MPGILIYEHAHADIVGVNAGKQWMRRRKPVNVKSFSIVHNAIMFFASLYMVIETLRQVRRAPAERPLPIPEGRSKFTAYPGCLHRHTLQCHIQCCASCRYVCLAQQQLSSAGHDYA